MGSACPNTCQNASPPAIAAAAAPVPPSRLKRSRRFIPRSPVADGRPGSRHYSTPQPTSRSAYSTRADLKVGTTSEGESCTEPVLTRRHDVGHRAERGTGHVGGCLHRARVDDVQHVSAQLQALFPPHDSFSESQVNRRHGLLLLAATWLEAQGHRCQLTEGRPAKRISRTELIRALAD